MGGGGGTQRERLDLGVGRCVCGGGEVCVGGCAVRFWRRSSGKTRRAGGKEARREQGSGFPDRGKEGPEKWGALGRERVQRPRGRRKA